jgi:hypothetical protein
MNKPKPDVKETSTLDDEVREIERDILNAFRVKRNTNLADGAGAPGSTAAGDNRSGLPEADKERGRRD